MTILSSLTNRIFLASALLAVLPIGVAVLVVNGAVTTQAEAELTRGIEEAAALVDEYRSALFEHFGREARLIADLPILKAAVYDTDRATVQPIVEDYRRQLGADLFLVTNRDGDTLAAVASPGVPLDGFAAQAAVADARTGHEIVWFLSYPGGVLTLVSVPILIGEAAPEILGSLTVGTSLDVATATRLARLTDSQIAFAAGGAIAAATLPVSSHEALAGLVGEPGVQTVRLGEDEYVAVARPLSLRASIDAETGPVAVVLRSRTERLRFLRSLHTQLAATAALAVLAATLLSYGIARTVTKPLGTITNTMREMAVTGDLTRRIPVAQATGWHDEDAQLLATTFNSMTAAIARFQQQETQRERLSSLGRLSTVIAHEIRNPLMIIKASVRTLRRGGAAFDRFEEALNDIEGEITRLNRIVTDVLDFARPISFDVSRTDLNALCQDAAGAVQAERGLARVQLDLAQDVPSITTDGERLRLALVNVLSNAQHALQSGAAVDGDAGDGIVHLSTRMTGEDRVTVCVRDNGPGIAAEDLPRIFEPYFTTKRTGTGLGLAIVKNVVEGLGGSITVESRPGRTEVRVDLPLAAPEARGRQDPSVVGSR